MPRDLHIDVTPLRRSGRKLGLGSSAAAAAAAAGAVFAWAGHDLARAEVRRRVLKAALEGHHAIAPEGSGADVAASVLGGFVRFRRPDMGSAQLAAPRAARSIEFEVAPVAWPEELEMRVVWTGAEARTSELVRKVRELQEREPARFEAAMGAVADQAARFVEAFEAGDARAVVAAAGAYGEVMAALGEAAGAPIVEENLRRVMDLAGRAGGSAKPSGAGGGDVAIAFFADTDGAAAFERACFQNDLTLLKLHVGDDGVSPLRC
ncbi:MAG: hypothetical protein ACOCUS_00290 [Polyangiales bacterium]